MSQQIINIGTTPNDGTGDTLRESQRKANENFTELYAGGTGGGAVETVTGTYVNNTDPANPIVIPQGIQETLMQDNTTDIDLNFVNGGGDEINIAPNIISASDVGGNQASFAPGIISANDSTTGKFTKLDKDGVTHFDGNESYLAYELTTQDNTHTLPNKTGTVAHLSDIPKRKEIISLAFNTASVAASPSWLAPNRESGNLLSLTMIADTYDNVTRVLGDHRAGSAVLPFNCRIVSILWGGGTIQTPITINIHSWTSTGSSTANNHTVGSKVISTSLGGAVFEFTGIEIDTSTVLNRGAKISALLFNNNILVGNLRFNVFSIEIEEVI